MQLVDQHAVEVPERALRRMLRLVIGRSHEKLDGTTGRAWRHRDEPTIDLLVTVNAHLEVVK